MRLMKLEQLLKPYDIRIEPGGKHFHARKDGFGVYPIPAHNGMKSEVGDKYLRALCRHFNLDPKKLFG